MPSKCEFIQVTINPAAEPSSRVICTTMVYRGPSKGCATCRRRRVACDEGRPTCQNCRRLNLSCAGYPKKPKIRFHDETQAIHIAEEHRQNRRQMLFRRPQEDVDQTVITFWMQNYAIAGRSQETSRNHIECVPHLFESCSPGSVLHLAILVLATSSVCMWAGMGPDASPVRKRLSRAFPRLQQALGDPAERVEDETLMATLILQCNDNLTALATIPSAAISHYAGAVALVKHRGRLNFRTEISKQLLLGVRSFLVSNALKNNEPVRDDADIWIDWSAMPNNSSTRLDRIGLQVATLQFEFSSNGSSHDDLAARATALDEQLMAWAACLPEVFQPKYLETESLPESIIEAGAYGERCEIFENVQIGNTWNTYRCYRLIVLGILTRCLSDDEVKSMGLAEVVQLIVDDICSSVPFHVGSRMESSCLAHFADPASIDFPIMDDLPSKTKSLRVRHATAQGGWHLLGPLAQLDQIIDENVKFSSIIATKQRSWIKSQLSRVIQLHLAPANHPSASSSEPSIGASSGFEESDRLSPSCIDQLRIALTKASDS